MSGRFLSPKRPSPYRYFFTEEPSPLVYSRSMKPWLILLWGAPAAGKSTLARCLSAEYQRRTHDVLPHLGTDKLNASIMGDNYEGSIRPQIYDCLLHLTEGLLVAGLPVMLEGTFLRPEMREKVALIAEHSEARLLSVQVECRLALRESRNDRRNVGAHVPESYLRQAHHLAKDQIRQADFVFDTELHEPEGLAAFLLGAVGVMPICRNFARRVPSTL